MASNRGRHRGTQRFPRGALALIAGAVVAGGGFALTLHSDTANPSPRGTPSVPVPGGAREPTPAGSVPPEAVAFAEAQGVRIYLPANDPVAVWYHQASYPDAVAMTPLGRLRRNANRTMFDPPPNTEGPAYIVMSARGRGTPATSAADIVLPKGTPVRSPVSGRVVQAKRYKLYGRYPDWRVEIAVAEDPDVHVVMIHLDGVRVRRGDEVSATLSVIGHPRVFPFSSQVDDYVTGGDPHVHIEVKEPSSKAASSR